MIRALFRMLGNLALFGASLAFLSAVTLMLVGSWLATYPLLRLSPRQRRLEAGMELTSAMFKLASTFSPRDDESVTKS